MMSRLFNSAAFKIFQFDVCSLAKHLKASETLVNRNYCNRGKEYVTLELPQGRIRGYKAQGLYGDCYCGFEGIPYAEPPLGRLRFLSPVPVKKWSGLKDCLDFANKPVQKNEWGMIDGSEDCLYLNVFTRSIRPIKKLPVLVCIPGGGFVKGGCPKEYVFGPDYFMMEEVILVTFNYRLSMFGFLSLCDPAAKVPGNAGLKDQVLALKWVRTNIELFGGDERNICVFGESAGGASVHYMLSTEHTQNVFQKAICQSGSFLHNWTVGYHNIEMSYYLACRKGYKGPRDNDILILKFLQSVPAEKLIDIDDLDLMARYKGYLYAFLPSIEPYECEDTIMSKPVWEIVKNAWGNKIPLIIGGCSFEGLYYYPTLKKLPDFLDHIVKNPVKLLPNDIPTNCEEKGHVERCEELAKTLTKVHFANKIVGRENILPVLDVTVPAEKLIDIDDLDTVGRYKSYLYAFMPSIEPYESEDSIITRPIWELIKSGWGNSIPLIVGGTSFEGLSMYPILKKLPEIVERLKNKRVKLLPNDVPIECTNMAKILSKLHFGEKQTIGDNVCSLLDEKMTAAQSVVHLLNQMKANLIPAEKLVDIDDLDTVGRYKGYFSAFMPSIEPYESDDSIIAKPIWELIRSAWGNNVPLILGATSFEGLCMYPVLKKIPELLERLRNKWERLLPNDVTACDDQTKLIENVMATHGVDSNIGRENMCALLDTSNPNCEYVCNWSSISEAGIQKWLNMGADWSFISIPNEVEEKYAAWDNLYGACLTVKTPQGMIRGLKLESVYGDSYYSFEGIPYAEPPVGKLRFKSPVPPKKWRGVRDCCRFTCKAIQKNQQGIIEGTEDCLYLNVYSKNINCANSKLPVMVWIHGGGFTTGSGIRNFICGPDYFMMENIVLVTFNYRLSMFGFLSLCDPRVQVPGNAGLKDQMLAIQWVKDNIDYFGGDSENITLFGQDAGGASVHYLLSSEHTRDLFQKAIIQSGCFLHEWALSFDAVQLSYLLACRKGYQGPKENDKCILEYLQSVPAEILVDIDDLDVLGRYKGYLYAFLPSVEPYESGDSIITKPVWDLIRCGWGNNIPLMIGGTSFEGLCMYPILKKIPELLERLRKKRERLLPNDIPCGCDYLNLTEELISAHFRENQISEEDILPFLDYYSYRLFWHGMYRLLQARSKYGNASTYLYRFDFDSPTFNHHRTIYLGNDTYRGVAHGDDLSYLFFSYYSAVLDTKSREYFIMRRMVKIWSTFAKNSDPNCEFVCTWDDVKTSGLSKWMNIACELTFTDIPEDVQEKFKIWNNLYGNRLIE
uniref:carboxylesterase n=1 Tax=Glossina palpalis gambiensis TaxID=67801 RepID=A0A1B0AZH6_9MUSC